MAREGLLGTGPHSLEDRTRYAHAQAPLFPPCLHRGTSRDFLPHTVPPSLEVEARLLAPSMEGRLS